MNRAQWLAINPARLVPELDYGTHWVDHHHRHVHRVVSWNPGTGELYSYTHDDRDDVEIHGIFPSRGQLDTALAGWQQHIDDGDGLGWLRRATTRAATLPPPTFGLVIGADGGRRVLTAPVTPSDAGRALAATVDAVTTHWPGEPPHWLTLYVDDSSHRDRRPPSHYASILYADRDADQRAGWEIEGDVVVCCANAQLPLPDDLVNYLCGGTIPATTARRQRPPAWIRHDLDTARRFQTAYRDRPATCDPYTAQMRHDNERDIVRLVAELTAAELDAATPHRLPLIATHRRPTGTQPGLSL
jgi:hypothetical protein